ncbi:hypothetical protein NPIL_401301 [Nephila pilipes]|uniref:Uncharacterized protein n=1 Tax=Nephila pilipes TaxID=299642 RepID=A0A8X6N319_NEPPI|nr:hypothetical protein NPIL_401301 [Nephila pilipes]
MNVPGPLAPLADPCGSKQATQKVLLTHPITEIEQKSDSKSIPYSPHQHEDFKQPSFNARQPLLHDDLHIPKSSIYRL